MIARCPDARDLRGGARPAARRRCGGATGPRAQRERASGASSPVSSTRMRGTKDSRAVWRAPHTVCERIQPAASMLCADRADGDGRERSARAGRSDLAFPRNRRAIAGAGVVACARPTLCALCSPASGAGPPTAASADPERPSHRRTARVPYRDVRQNAGVPRFAHPRPPRAAAPAAPGSCRAGRRTLAGPREPAVPRPLVRSRSRPHRAARLLQ
jgi:hypothetical protein